MSSKAVTADDVILYIREATGAELLRAKPLAVVLGRVDPLTPDDALRKRFGRFQIGVLLDRKSLHNAVPAGEPTSEGVFWEEQFPLDEYAPPYWSAVKFYGNVQLIWWSDNRALDARWKDLDQILRDLLREKGKR